MSLKSLLVFLATVCIIGGVSAQITTCTTLGQNPSTAFPVCGTDVFSQDIVPDCGRRPVPGPCADDPLTDVRPFWYKFTCFSPGNLGFVITPNDLGDDYDWQLFDITGRNPNDVFTDVSLFVSCNWSGDFGKTGASTAGTSLNACAGNTPIWSSMPSLIQGHEYLLLISHFTDSQSGYKLSFEGGTASITDPTLPLLQSANANCEGLQVTVKLNKKMKCSSLAQNGSDFTISPGPYLITSASAQSCNGGFDMDSVILMLDQPLPVGNYTISAKNGGDANTLLDNCARNIPIGDNVNLIVSPVQPTLMDSLTTVTCAPGVLKLIFRKPIRCSSIAGDGSDFFVTGPSLVSVAGASGICNSNGGTNLIEIRLTSPVSTGGTYQVNLAKGTDGNTLIDECGQQTPAGSTLSFITKDTVSANFKYAISSGCRYDTASFSHDGRNGVNEWKWTFDNFNVNLLQNPVKLYTTSGQKQVRLIVSNGFCNDTTSVNIKLDRMKAAFGSPDVICASDTASFMDLSTGLISSWNWDFGNGNGSLLQSPPAQKYPPSITEKLYDVRLIVQNSSGCSDTSAKKVKVVGNCFIAVPSAFTPNGDMKNDYLFPSNAYKADHLLFSVYNRYGQLVFQTKDWTLKWDGRVNGQVQDTGAYVWTLTYTNRDTGKKYSLKGTTVLIR